MTPIWCRNPEQDKEYQYSQTCPKQTDEIHAFHIVLMPHRKNYVALFNNFRELMYYYIKCSPIFQ
jgi:hypothetical protein